MTHWNMRIGISREPDALHAALRTRKFAEDNGFNLHKTWMLGTAASELAHNILKYAGRGEIKLRTLQQLGNRGIELQAEDHGPGIDDVDQAMQDHVSSGGTLGLGLPGVRRLMDTFALESVPEQGTRVTVIKWRL